MNRNKLRKPSPSDNHLARTQPLSDRRVFVLSAILAIVTLVIYSNCYDGQFVLDDRGKSILQNPTTDSLSKLGKVLIPPSDATVTSRPLLNLTLAINYQFEGVRSTRGYHAVNVAIHAINSILLFGLIRQTLRGPRLAEKYGMVATELAFACALLWVAHPLCTSCVTYIVQRAESLMTMFLLATLYCSYCADRSVAYRNSWSIAAFVVCGLGMASKEVMFVAPFLVPIYDWVFGRNSFSQLWERRNGFYLGLMACWSVLFWTMTHGTRHSIAFNFFGTHPLIDVTSWDYAKTQAPIVLHYLGLALWPHPLVFDYDWPIVQSMSEWIWQAVIVVGLGVASVVALVRRMPVGFTGFLFFLMLGPSSSFLVIYKEVAAEHRMYLPLAAVIVTLVIGGWSLGQNLLRRVDVPRSFAVVIAWTPVVLAALLLAWLTYHRNVLFHDRLELWRQTAANAPRGARPHHNAGMLYGNLADKIKREARELEENGRSDESLAMAQQAEVYSQKMFDYLRKAIEINPAYPEAYYNLGRELYQARRIDEAAESLRTASELFGKRPGHLKAELSYVNVLIQQDQYVEAKRRLQQLVDANQTYRDAWQRLAELYVLAPDDQVRDGARAHDMVQPLLQQGKTPRDVEILAAAQAEQGKYQEAAKTAASLIQHYEEVGDTRRRDVMRKRHKAYANGRALYWVTGERQ